MRDVYPFIRMNRCEDIDPLQHALNRGSDGLAFVNSPLVMDYLHLKFMRTIPTWWSRTVPHENVDESFRKYPRCEYPKTTIDESSRPIVRSKSDGGPRITGVAKAADFVFEKVAPPCIRYECIVETSTWGKRKDTPCHDIHQNVIRSNLCT